ncbi:uncharacterized protein (TIGR00290 family) [Oikeobacillus pervagus]|uniref:Uncharacterized protein (TIGR00290 family) n=1 Tax=Oikeobacillus pervagus TaxID=1325931 RepID=A0AAJ1WL63_9BACI|nr:diphthine--ammonia ligase [Oikeobacillus pervagus]MDQ0215866.1 uncharacterized protein (TIGR00290 family) [Oikeobacillus pervagus]
MKKRIALSWSGGKDSCITLDRLVKESFEVACLVTTVPKNSGRTFAHGEKKELIQLQSEALHLPVHWIDCALEHYTENFIESLKELKSTYQLTSVAFGDLYLDGHREWGENVAKAAGLEALYPIWIGSEKASLQSLQTFVQSQYNAVIVKVRSDCLNEDWLGRELDQKFVQEIRQMDVCPMGENGEYHTFVYNGPLFEKKIDLSFGEVQSNDTSKRLEIADFSLKEKA